MNTKELLISLCAHLQEELSRWYPRAQDKEHEVRLFSGVKPSNYFLSVLIFTPVVEEPLFDWFVEIWVDERCIYRVSRLVVENDKEALEEILLKELLQAIFVGGVLSSMERIEDYLKIKKMMLSNLR